LWWVTGPRGGPDIGGTLVVIIDPPEVHHLPALARV